MSDLEEPITNATIAELVRRLGVSEAEKEALAGELARVREQLEVSKEDAAQKARSAEHWEGVYRESSGAYHAREYRVDRLAQKLRALRSAIAEALSVDLLKLIDQDDEEEGKRYR